MNARSSSIHPRLRAIDHGHAATQTALIAALNHREVEDMRTAARVASTRDRRAAAAWIQFQTARGPILIAPLLVDNQLARMTSGPGLPDGAAAAATLGRIEPLVSAIEMILGAELHPAGLATEATGDLLLIRLDAHERGGGMRHRLLLACPADVDIEPLPLPDALPARLGALALRWTAHLPLPRIPARSLAALSVGDCIVTGIGPLAGHLALPGGRRHHPLTADPKAGTITLHRAPQEEDAHVSDMISRVEDVSPMPTGGGPEWADLKIAATIEFDGGRLTAAQMATLGEGSVLPLPTAGGTLAVRVVAGGAIVAEGELVAVGEGFGVLVTAVKASDAQA
jgi:type III secretion protein Q